MTKISKSDKFSKPVRSYNDLDLESYITSEDFKIITSETKEVNMVDGNIMLLREFNLSSKDIKGLYSGKILDNLDGFRYMIVDSHSYISKFNERENNWTLTLGCDKVGTQRSPFALSSRELSSKLMCLSYYENIDTKDQFHGLIHTVGVNTHITLLLEKLEIYDHDTVELCRIAGYWHDVGRKYKTEDHEVESERLFKEYSKIRGDWCKEDIKEVSIAILEHNWRTKPTTDISRILQDADKLDFYTLLRLEAATIEQIKEVYDLYDIVYNTVLNHSVSKELFKSYYESSLSYMLSRMES